jgi:hypothetical protein
MTARISPEERREIKKRAEAANLSLAEYVRRRALGKRVMSQGDLVVVAELRWLSEVLNRIGRETQGKYSEPATDAIRAIENYIQALEQSCKDKRNKKAPEYEGVC